MVRFQCTDYVSLKIKSLLLKLYKGGQMNRKHAKYTTGSWFTLIKLLVVISVIAVLGSDNQQGRVLYKSTCA